tara:strand:- start:128 stop:1144 length:1017 start_codon:yes stop_codon:yes gene_type:complete
MNYLYFIFSIILIIILNNFLIKKNYILSLSGDKHQKFTSRNSIPLTGGIFLVINFFIIFNSQISFLFLFIFLIFLTGLFSDIKLINSAKLRFFLQSLIVLTLVITFDLKILSTRIIPLDELLKSNYINYIFVSFCILIIVNGSNFIDGLNTLVIGYYLILTIILYNLNLFSKVSIENSLIILWIFFLLAIYILNFTNRLFLGDSGAYFLGFTYSILLIMIYRENQTMSPYFIVLLLWYPGFENLFSIIRKFKTKFSPLSPDTNHLHQLMFMFLNKNLLKKKFYANVFAGNIINLYNLIILFFATNDISKTNLQLSLIFVNLFIYLITYFLLKKKLEIH